jgi:uncharacterized repeat protein (TIGR01451 family)
MLRRPAYGFVILVLILSALPAVAQSSAAQSPQIAGSTIEALALPALHTTGDARTKAMADLSGQLQPDVISPIKHDTSPALHDMQPDSASAQPTPRAIPGMPLPKFSSSQVLIEEEDTTIQSQQGPSVMPPTQFNFEGIANLFGGWPPDTQGDIGSNHYVQWINLHFAIWSIDRATHTAALVYGPAPGNTLWQGFGGACETTNSGDPITLYDTQARRWFMSQFALPNFPNGPFLVCIAVSTSDDPTGTWYRYAYQWTNGTGQPVMNDYPKFGVWPDGYYMTVNQFAASSLSWAGAGVATFERNQMLQGLPAQMVKFDLFSVNPAFGGMLPSDLDGSTPPPAGAPNVFAEVDDAASIPPNDAMRLWQFHVDWTNPLSSTFGINGQPNTTLTVAAFNPLTTHIPQPGTPQTLDNLADRLMYRLAYRNFGDHAALVVNHTVDAGTARAGVRWYEVRDPYGSPVIHQQSTYAPADGLHRWMGSLALDHNGNAALGYSVASNTVYPSIRYAGRMANDPLGEMSQGEAEIIAGSGSQTGHYRWGDYSMMGIDPVDDCTFWYTQEYVQTTGSNTWQTHVGAFKFPSCSTGPQGTLAGVISDAATSNPIAGAQIKAAVGPTQTVNATSGAGGTYSAVASVGTYTVTASAYAYLPSQITGVSIISGTTTTLNIALTPAATYIVSGTIRDAMTGWPLYANLDIAGYPGGSIWNDPVTGYYSITLAEGITYTFNVNAGIPGYLPGGRSVGQLTTNRTESFTLNADLVACRAPGYLQSPLTGVYSETFEASNGGYTTGGYTSWAWGMPTSGPGYAHSGLNVWATNLMGNYYDYEDGYATSPSIDLSAHSGRLFSLAWWQWLVTESNGDYASVEVSNDGGLNWVRVYGEIAGNVDQVWAQHSITLDPSYGVSNFRVRFRLRSNSYFTYPGWYVDDMRITALACSPQPGGLVVGNVYDANIGNALNGATVTNDRGQTTMAHATPADPGIDEAFYALFSSAGVHPITATMADGYGTDVHTPTVVQSDTIRQNFNVPSGWLSYAPPAVIATLDMGTSMTRSFTLTNSGGGTATFDLLELDKGATPLGSIEKPEFVVKPFRQNFVTAAGLGLPPLPSAPPYAAGGVIRSWPPTGLGDAPWGIAYDSNASTVWVSEGWGSTDSVIEYAPNGTATGRLWTHTLNPNGPADLTFNFNTGMAWIMNVASPDNCIYEMNPATGFTGAKICPGIGISQRGLAYDPSTDTYFAGSWNDLMIHHFDSAGTILDEVNVGLPIAGLAYNADTMHLFVMVSADPNPVYVLDAANNYALLGQFNVSQGFGTFSGAGLEIDCDGNLWAVDQNTNTVYQFQSGETTSICARDVPWLSESPISGTIAALTAQSVVVSFDASVPQITQPGQYYAQVKIKEDTPYSIANTPVTMTVTAPATWGKLSGTVTGLGHCDADPVSLANATVSVQSGDGMTWTLTTNISGTYQVWLDQVHSPLTVTASHAGYVTQTTTGITVTQQLTTNQNFVLRLDVPCISANPTNLSIALNLGQSATLPLTLTNTGAGAATFSISEQSRRTLYVATSPTVAQVNNTDQTVSSQIAGFYPLAIGDFTSKAPSPVPLTSITVDSGTGYIYGQQNSGYSFYRYDPATNTWTTLSTCPLYSGNNGGAAYLNGKIYTVYTGDSSQMGVYDIATNSWSTISNGLGQGTGNITTDGEYIYLAAQYMFRRYNPVSSTWSSLATPSIGFEPWGGLSYLNGTIYGHQGNGSTGFAKYDVASNMWTTLSSMPGGAVLGSAIDPTDQVYYAYGSYGGQNWYAFDLVSQTWSVSTIPLFSINDGGMAFVGQSGVSGIYFVQGESGTGLGRFETAPYSESVPWLSENPISGTLSVPGSQVISVTFDAGVPEVTQPGDYFATLNVASNDLVHSEYALPITMTAIAPATWGKLNGTVTGLGYCDVKPGTPLADATVFVQSNDGMTWTLTTNISGTYQVWLDQAHSPLTVTVTAANHQARQASGVIMTGQLTTTTNFDLRWLRPCLGVSPTQFAVTVDLGASTTRSLTLTNNGASSATFELLEQDRGATPNLPAFGIFAPAPNMTGLRSDQVTAFPVRPSTPQGTAGSGVLLIQDYLAWGSNAMQSILMANGISYTVINSSQIAATDFSPYHMIIVPSVQGSSYNIAFNANLSKFEDYIDAGGLMLMGFCEQYGDMPYLNIPFGGINNWSPADNNYIVDPTHPIFTGVPNPYSGTSASHSYLSGLLPGDRILVTSGTVPGGNVVMIERKHGAGLLVAGGQTFEFGWATGQGAGAILSNTIPYYYNNWGGDVPWLSEVPITGTVAADSAQPINVTFDAGVPEVTQPGDYFATLNIASNDPAHSVYALPITMTAVAPATWGKLNGTVTGLGLCDAKPGTPLVDAIVFVQSGDGMTWTLTTTISGTYQVWLDQAHSPLTVTVTPADYQYGQTTGVIVTAGLTTSVNFDLRWLHPCLSSSPKQMTVTVGWGMSTTLPLTLTNVGAAGATFQLVEQGASLTSTRATKQPVVSKSQNAFMVNGVASDKPAPQRTRMETPVSRRQNNHPQAGLTVIDFDDFPQPCSFISTTALRDEYQSRGIRFNGPGGNNGGAILDQCSGFSVSGYSPPNFLGFNAWTSLSNGGIPRGPEEITLLGTASFVQVNAGSSEGSGYPITLEAFNLAGSSLGSHTITLASVLQPLLVTADGIARVVISTPASVFVLDDLTVDLHTDIPWLSESPITGTLAAGTAQPINVTFDASVPEVTQPGNYYATLVISTNDVSTPQLRVPVTLTVSPAMPDLSTSTKVVNKTVAHPGDTLTYTLTVTNTGNTTANVILIDPIPAGLTYSLGSASNAAYNDTTNRIEWSGPLAINAQRVITFRATVNAGPADGTPITNTLTLNDGINPDVVKTATTVIGNRPDLSISTKTVDRAMVHQGGTVTYTITLINMGNVAASVTITDPLPSGAGYVLGSGTYNSVPSNLYNDVTNRVEWSGSVPFGGSVTLTFRAVITAASGTLVTNTVSIDDGRGTIIIRQAGTQAVRYNIYLPSVMKQ